ncbi:MAG: CCA tRNA nucleotidyltransferase [Methanophagales archaeon]|nr:CCA tRNA nucleotidyltransferase [Methanophagales archaeon]
MMEEKEEEEIKRICREVIERIRPDEEERRKVKAVAERIIAKLNKKAPEMGMEVHAISVGSTARNTWISGEADIDVFIMFPEDVPEEELKEKGLALAKSISDRYEERYASHPYIHAYFHDAEGRTEYEVDLVPCFSVKAAPLLKSAVDRTPFHNEYIVKRISGLEEEVLLLKQFLKCRGIYGSEQRRKGFSGYLCELLSIRYSSFVELLRHASKWKCGERIDIEGRGKYKGEGKDPLIVIDPVDPNRNVAAAVSWDSFCRLIDAARDFLACPDASFFALAKEKGMSKAEFVKLVKERGTELVMVLFEAPDVVEDVLFPQLRRAEASVTSMIERNGFMVHRSDVSVEGDKAFLVFELLVWCLPEMKKHVGPPVTLKHHSEQFKNKYKPFSFGKRKAFTEKKNNSDVLLQQPVRIENGRYVVEVKREYTDAVELLKSELKSCGLGKQVSEAINKGYEVLKNEEIIFFEGLGSFFRGFFGFGFGRK